MNTDVVIIIEHKNRELESAVALKLELEKRGLSSVILQEGWDEGPCGAAIRPKVVVTPWCYDDDDVRRLCTYNGQDDGRFDIVNLHCEQITNSDASTFVIPTGRARDAYHCAWGDFFEEWLSNEGIGGDMVRVTGSSRLDFFRDEYRGLSATKADLSSRYGIDPTKKWILVVGNFSAAFMSNERITELEGRGIDHFRENSELAAATYEKVLAWMREALNAKNANSVEMVYRPHPSEPITERLISIERDYANFHVIKELVIRDWFLNVDCDFMWCSTSSVEAAYAGIPVFALRPFPVPQYLRFDLLEHVEQVNSASEFVELIDSLVADGLGDLDTEFLRHIDRYCLRGTSTAAARTADYISEVVAHGKRLFSCDRPPLYRPRKVIHYVLKILAHKVGVLGKIGEYAILNDDYLAKGELSALESRIRALNV